MYAGKLGWTIDFGRITMIGNREPWIDTAKAVSLIGIIAVHAALDGDESIFLTGFVIPVFFILYGVTHNSEKHRNNMKQCTLNRFRTLMIPYVLLSVCQLVFYSFSYPMIDGGYTPLEYLAWQLYGNGPIGRTSHLWFLRTLFLVTVVFLLVDRYLHDKPSILRFSVIILSPGFGVMIQSVMGVELLPWGIDSVFIALSFVMIGNEIARHREISSWNSKPSVDIIVVPLSMIFVVWLSTFNGFVNIGGSLYGQSIYLHMITGVLGTYNLSVLCYYLCKIQIVKNIFSNFDEYSQVIYEIHPLLMYFNSVLIWEVFAIPTDNPIFVFNLIFGISVSWLVSSQIICRSRVLRFAFLGISAKDSPSIEIDCSEESRGKETEVDIS